MNTIYLDNNATTPILPEVLDAMMFHLTESYGNPSSVHHQGTRPAAALREARRTIAASLGCSETEIVLTSCGTESDSSGIRGLLEAHPDKKHIVTTSVEHSAVLDLCKHLIRGGYQVTTLGVDAQGQIDLDELRSSLRDDTALVTIMWVNNETGVILPMEQIAKIVSERNIPLHVDAVQAFGKIPVDLSTIPIDTLAISAHKFHGPKGVGALYIRKATRCTPQLWGGNQEQGRRAGTENVAGAVAMAKACEMAVAKLDYYNTEVRRLRDKFEQEILTAVPDCSVIGGDSERTPNTSNIRFAGVTGRAMLLRMDELGICASAGSACKSGADAPSAVLDAMGFTPQEAVGSVRFSISSLTTEAEIDFAIEHIPQIVADLRTTSSSTTPDN